VSERENKRKLPPGVTLILLALILAAVLFFEWIFIFFRERM
jgi:hypothetical protein